MGRHWHPATLWIGPQPGLTELDLSDHGPGLVLELDELPALRKLVLPETASGTRILLRVRDRLPSLEILGPIADLHIHWLMGERCNSMFGHYGLPSTYGMILGRARMVPHSRTPGLEARSDQASGGLRFRRPGTEVSSSGWQLLTPTRSLQCFDDFFDWLAQKPDRIVALVVSRSVAMTGLRQSIIDTLWREKWRGLRGRQLQDRWTIALNDLVRDGVNPSAAWVLRCILNLAVWGESRPWSLREVVHRARSAWPGERRERRPSVCLREADLALMAPCRYSPLSRPAVDRVRRSTRLHQLETLAEATVQAKVGAASRYWLAGLLSDCLRNRRERWAGQSCLPEVARLSDVLEFSRQSDMPYLDGLIRRLPLIADQRCNEQFVALGKEHLRADDQAEIGVALVEAGVREARTLLLAALYQGSWLEPELRARASEALLVPLDSMASRTAHGSKHVMRHSTSEVSGQCEASEEEERAA